MRADGTLSIVVALLRVVDRNQIDSKCCSSVKLVWYSGPSRLFWHRVPGERGHREHGDEMQRHPKSRQEQGYTLHAKPAARSVRAIHARSKPSYATRPRCAPVSPGSRDDTSATSASIHTHNMSLDVCRCRTVPNLLIYQVHPSRRTLEAATGYADLPSHRRSHSCHFSNLPHARAEEVCTQ